ncbi:MAG TPA: SPW repeat protein [Longimicrobiaceae bacterium]
MAAISTRAHGALDYVLAIAIGTSPWWAGFAGANPESWIAVGLALAVALTALLTDHELGLRRWIQMPLHLWIDAIVGILLAASPWVLNFDQRVWAPHLVAGLLLLILAVASHTIPGYERRRAARAGVD